MYLFMQCDLDLYLHCLLFFLPFSYFFVNLKLLKWVHKKISVVTCFSIWWKKKKIFCTVWMEEFIYLSWTCHRPKAYSSSYHVSLLDLNHPRSSLPPTFRPFANSPSSIAKQYISLCLHSGDNATSVTPVSHSCQTPYKIAVSYTEALAATPKKYIS